MKYRLKSNTDTHACRYRPWKFAYQADCNKIYGVRAASDDSLCAYCKRPIVTLDKTGQPLDPEQAVR
jgi:hypothetical protein